MDCQFCNTRAATRLRVPTAYGVASLCDRCAEGYGRINKPVERAGCRRRRQEARAGDGARQMVFPILEMPEAGPSSTGSGVSHGGM